MNGSAGHDQGFLGNLYWIKSCTDATLAKGNVALLLCLILLDLAGSQPLTFNQIPIGVSLEQNDNVYYFLVEISKDRYAMFRQRDFGYLLQLSV